MQAHFKSQIVFITFTACLTAFGIFFLSSQKRFVAQKVSSPHIHIAAVICGDNTPRDEAAVMIKSVIISAKLYRVHQITFHILVEHVAHGNHLWSKLQEYGYPFQDVEVDLFTYEIQLVIPIVFHGLLFQNNLRCMYGRHFLPRVLSNLDAVLYFDADFIVLGDVSRFWDFFAQMNSDQMIGVSIDNEPDCPFNSPYYTSIPYLKPKGLASGMLVMNLTKMRLYEWEQKFLRLYQDYSLISRKPLVDQQVLNILLYYNTGALLLIPCQYNFWQVYCTLNVACCSGAVTDPQGIVAIAGASNTFYPGQPFREFYVIYDQLNLTDPNLDIARDLVLPIRSAYSQNSKPPAGSSRLGQASSCDGTIHKYLFKNVFV